MPAIRILHVNDTEGDPSVLWPRLAATLRRLRESDQPDVLLHAGDLPLDGVSAATIRRIIGELRFDAVALGNHDHERCTFN
jgi:2',3'-cyclic-nucleotide 2'-phosphodiesterase (5'-nucleotidase family)